MKRGIIEENEQTAGTSREPDPRAQGVEARKRKRNENSTGLDESVSFKPGTVSEDDFVGIAHQLALSWKKVGLALKVPKAVIDQIEAKSDIFDKCYSVLRCWRERNPASVATYHCLANALKDPTVGRVDLAETFCGRQSGTSSEPESTAQTMESREQKRNKDFTALTSRPNQIIEWIQGVCERCERVILPVPWCEELNFQIKNIFTRLTIFEKERTRGIMTKEVTSMTSIFAAHKDCKKPLIVLIEGKPGVGKTTYCQKLVYDWASKQCHKWDKSFPRVDVLLLFRCCDMKSTLWDAIEDQIRAKEIEPEERKMFLQFLKENPSKVLLVFDGLDEADEEKLKMCLKLVRGEELLGCYIVLTSRLKGGNKVRPYIDTLLEIVGFTTTDAELYIRKFFQHEEHLAKELISKVSFDEDLKELIKSPLNTLLLCVIFEDLKGILPNNRTKLYVEIVLLILRRYESKNGSSNRDEDLLLAYKKELMILGKSALESLCKRELYFDDHKKEIRESLLMKFGFLSIQSGGIKGAPCDRYGFVQKSFQEFFSGYYLAFSVIDADANFHSVLTGPQYMDELFQVFKFMSGIIALKSKQTAESVVRSIASIVNETGRIYITDRYISYLKAAHYFINECKTCPGDPCTKLVHTFGENLNLEDIVVNPSSQVCDNEVTGTFLQALTCNSTVSNLKLFNLEMCEVENLLVKVIKNTSLSSLKLESNFIGAKGANSLAQALRATPSLSSLDVSKNSVGNKGANSLAQSLGENTTLSSLVLQSNFIGAEGANSLAKALRVNTSISSLDLSDNLVGGDGANSLAKALMENTTLSSLNLGHNSIGDEGANSLAQALRVNTALSSLDLPSNSIGAVGGDSLARAIEVNNYLSSLDMSKNKVGVEGANSFAQALRVNTSLSSLDLGHNFVDDEGAKSLAEVLGRKTSLSTLHLCRNSINDKGANSLAQALKLNTSLSSLDLSYNSVGNEGANSFAQALRENTTLFSLILCRNYIGDEGANSLAQALREKTSLSSLILCRNSICDEGANSLAQALRVNTSLSSLDLSYNSVGAEGANSLAQALKLNTSLSSLDLSYNSFGNEGANSFAQALRENTTLFSLILCCNCIGDEGANSLAQALREKTSLSSLILCRNSVCDEGANSLARALRVNTSLSSLDLSYNSVGAEGANSLAQALRVNTSLSSLDLSNNSVGTDGASLLLRP